jgi:hypothetical protein
MTTIGVKFECFNGIAKVKAYRTDNGRAVDTGIKAVMTGQTHLALQELREKFNVDHVIYQE